MSKAELNMAVMNLSNDLVAEGYCFRLYDPGWLRTYMRGTKNSQANLEPDEAAQFALDCFLDPNNFPDLSLHDWEENDMPW